VASITASGAVKYPADAVVSAAFGGLGLAMMLLHFVQILALSRCADPHTRGNKHGINWS
jgi:hypothetical protein